MKRRQSFLKIIREKGIQILLFVAAFYLVSMLIPLINLPFSNKYEVVSIPVNIKYNPFNNYLSYVVVVVFVPILFFLFKKIYLLKNFKIIRLIVIFILVLQVFLSQTHVYSRRAGTIDMLHDGEQLSPASGMFLFNKKPYQDMFFLHGGYLDAYSPFLSFKLFGYSPGSFYLFLIIEKVIAAILVLMLLYYLIKNELVFYLAAIFLSTIFSFGRGETIVYLSIFLTVLTVFKKINKSVGLFLLSFLLMAGFYISIDRSFFNFLPLSLYLLFSVVSIINKDGHKTIKIEKKNLIVCVLGFLLSVMLGVYFMGFDVFKTFLKMSFTEIPAFASFLFDYQYQPLRANTFIKYWLPIIIQLSTVIFFLANYKKIKSLDIGRYIIFIYLIVLSITSFRGALGRCDDVHTFYVLHYTLLCLFMTVDLILSMKDFWVEKIVGVLSLFLLFFLPAFNLDNILSSVDYTFSDFKMTLALPKFNDNYWLTEEQWKVKEYIQKNTKETDSLFVFSNEAAYYFITKRENPTRFYLGWYAEPNIYHDEVLRDLDKNMPKYIIYSSDFWANWPDGISNEIRMKYLTEWISKNYVPDIKIGSTDIYKKIKK